MAAPAAIPARRASVCTFPACAHCRIPRAGDQQLRRILRAYLPLCDSPSFPAVKNLIVYADSELVVKQINGEYQVKNEGIRLLL